ncbi:MAG TPA: DUF6242 domain-containing protein [Paludibacter sp.]|nr:DUF6242 domain-containing protein [Paludibacter sp.]
MKLSNTRILILAFVAVVFASCDWLNNNVDTNLSADPTFTSLKFASDTQNPGLSKAVFTLVYDSLDNSLVITNLDSLPYNTSIEKVVPTFTFTSTSEIKLYLRNSNDSIALTGKDTVDFRNVVKVRNIAANGVASRTYYLKVNVHKVNPGLYVWTQATNHIAEPATNQKAILFGDQFFYYLNNGIGNELYTSTNGYGWQSKTDNLSGLATTVTYHDLLVFNGKLFFSDNGNKIYWSADGFNWNSVDKSGADFTFMSFLFVLQNKIWAVVRLKSLQESLQKYYFASSTDGANWALQGEIPDNFPVSGFAALSFSTRNGFPKALVVGGNDTNGKLLRNRWSTENGTYWVDFSLRDRTLDTLAAGASIIPYDNKLFAIGLRTDSLKPTVHFKVSVDEGYSWQKPDTLNRLPQDFIPRAYNSMLVFKPRDYNKYDPKSVIEESNRIFIIGGKTGDNAYSDVWTGKLNRKNFLRQ